MAYQLDWFFLTFLFLKMQGTLFLFFFFSFFFTYTHARTFFFLVRSWWSNSCFMFATSPSSTSFLFYWVKKETKKKNVHVGECVIRLITTLLREQSTVCSRVFTSWHFVYCISEAIVFLSFFLSFFVCRRLGCFCSRKRDGRFLPLFFSLQLARDGRGTEARVFFLSFLLFPFLPTNREAAAAEAEKRVSSLSLSHWFIIGCWNRIVHPLANITLTHPVESSLSEEAASTSSIRFVVVVQLEHFGRVPQRHYSRSMLFCLRFCALHTRAPLLFFFCFFCSCACASV